MDVKNVEGGPLRAEDIERAAPRAERRALTFVFFVIAVFFLLWLIRYYMTGAGGPTLLAVTMVPVAFIIVTLNDLRREWPYPRLGRLNYLVVGVYCTVAAVSAVYLHVEFEAIRTVRLGFWNTTDMVIGGAMVFLVLEYTRRRYMPLFIVNVLLILYTVYGFVVPGRFRHPGLSWERVLTSLSLEITTGIFERLPQLALTLIGSFILVLAVLRGFGCIDSILRGSAGFAKRSPHLLPQSAVVGSFSVASVSGSGAANAATTGSVTIPALIRSGLPRVNAAAVETASSLGGQLMPPLMGISAFLMADFLGVSYFDVVARGFAPAFIYFFGVSYAVYLLTARHKATPESVPTSPVTHLDRVNILAFVAAVGGLIYLMGVERVPAMTSAQRVFFLLLAGLAILFVGRTAWRWRQERRLEVRELPAPFAGFVETFSVMTAELTLLLSTLGILTAAFTVTGVPTTLGVVIMELADFHIVAMIVVGFLFGYVVGMGLPPAPTYIVTAVVIGPFFIAAGIEPWVVHFFAFFVAVFGELSPPTSVTAAVTSAIAEASFMRTMIVAIAMCLPLIILMFGVFTRPELVLEPGLAQLMAFGLLLVGTMAMGASLFATIAVWLRGVLAVLSLVLILSPNLQLAAAAMVPTVVLLIYGFVAARRRVAAAEPVPT